MTPDNYSKFSCKDGSMNLILLVADEVRRIQTEVGKVQTGFQQNSSQQKDCLAKEQGILTCDKLLHFGRCSGLS